VPQISYAHIDILIQGLQFRKIVVIFDSKTGNTEKMAKAIAEGAKTVEGVQIELHKIGTRFSMHILDQAHGIILVSPTEYGNVTPGMRAFIESMVDLKKAKKLKLDGKTGGAFGSYGWDGGWVTDRLARSMKSLGIELASQPLSMVDMDVKKNSLDSCQELGKKIAEKLVNS
jgi:flavorubredoxin